MEKIIPIEDFSYLQNIFGIEDKNLKFLEKELKVKIFLKPQGILIKGDGKKISHAINLIDKLTKLGEEGVVFSQKELKAYLTSQSDVKKTTVVIDEDRKGDGKYEIKVSSSSRKYVLPKTDGQKAYIDAIRAHDISFSIGPAGTGKTYLAMAMAVNALIEKKVRRIVLTRPAIEAGESLGFLPGGMSDKLGPYLRPLYDALYDMMEAKVIENNLEKGVIEIAPLAYMRGRSLNNAFVILDEAQNCTSDQLKMFITRLGFDSKTVIAGDITQSDLPGGKPLGLVEAIKILKPIKGIKIVNLTKEDVVRHPLVQKIIQAYEDFYKGEIS